MRYLLAGMLVVVAAVVCQAEAPDGRPTLIGMSVVEVRNVMGEPSSVGSWESAWIDHLSAYWYFRTDCIGGVRIIHVSFGAGERVNKVHTYYLPFADRPPWMDAQCGAVMPPKK